MLLFLVSVLGAMGVALISWWAADQFADRLYWRAQVRSVEEHLSQLDE